MMKLKKYSITSSLLKPFSHFLWHMSGDTPVVNGKLLPVVNIDLLITASVPIFYHYPGEEPLQAPSVHMRNVRLRPQIIEQAAGYDVWGISLASYGVYPFAGDMNGRREGVIDLYAEHPQICFELTEGVHKRPEASECAAFIEEQVGRLVRFTIPDDDRDRMNDYFDHMLSCGVGDYCDDAGIGIKRLERMLKKYTGLTPKQVQRVARFQQAGNEIIYREKPQSLVDITYAHQYADQTHFTKSFREYAGVTPFQFMHQADTIKKQIHQHQE